MRLGAFERCTPGRFSPSRELLYSGSPKKRDAKKASYLAAPHPQGRVCKQGYLSELVALKSQGEMDSQLGFRIGNEGARPRFHMVMTTLRSKPPLYGSHKPIAATAHT